MEVITDSKSNLAPRAGEAITKIADQHPETPLLLMFSGGSALAIIEHIDAEQFDERSTLTVLDERHGVSEEHSNMAQLEATDFYERATANGAHAIDPRGIEDEDLEETAAWFESALRGWRDQNRNGLIVITQGIGEDGHTAGILPGSDAGHFKTLFVQTDRWAVGCEYADDTFPKRVTVTVPFLQGEVTSAVVYVAGDQKQTAFERVLNEPDSELAEMPARVIHRMNDVLVFSDRENPLGE